MQKPQSRACLSCLGTPKSPNVAEAELERRKLKGKRSQIMKILWSIERRVDSRGLSVESERSINIT